MSFFIAVKQNTKIQVYWVLLVVDSMDGIIIDTLLGKLTIKSI